jgi:uncharacterized membrane protein YkvA (DUF1232 family)
VAWLAARDPRVPWYAKLLALVVAGYALSPIDLVPDFIPVLGLIDDLVLVPAGLWLVLRLIPEELVAELRVEASRRVERPVSRAGAAGIVLLWLVAAGAMLWWLLGTAW